MLSSSPTVSTPEEATSVTVTVFILSLPHAVLCKRELFTKYLCRSHKFLEVEDYITAPSITLFSSVNRASHISGAQSIFIRWMNDNKNKIGWLGSCFSVLQVHKQKAKYMVYIWNHAHGCWQYIMHEYQLNFHLLSEDWQGWAKEYHVVRVHLP